jgi:hypothetical protein
MARNTISNSDDVIDSRDIIARIEELQGQQTARFVAGWNMPGYMPDSDPAQFESAEDARAYIIETIKRAEDEADTETLAEELCAFAEDINLESDEFSATGPDGLVYWVTEDGVMGLDDEESEELRVLLALQEDAGSCDDWHYGATLIRDSYFETYAQELADDIGAVNADATWPNNCIDWERAARELQQDYISVEFDGVTYWVR